MQSFFTEIFKSVVLSAIFLILYQATAAQDISIYNRELTRLKDEAKARLSAQVDEFNSYPDRPASDGPYNQTNNKAFLLENAPLFYCSDSVVSKVYNYRWWMISKHIKEYQDPYDNKKYWVITDFFGVKPWSSLSGAITCPAGQQFYDVRWLRDDKYLKSYADYFMSGSASKLNQRENDNFLTYLSRPESHHFSSWMINGIDAFLKVHPNRPGYMKNYRTLSITKSSGTAYSRSIIPYHQPQGCIKFLTYIMEWNSAFLRYWD